MSKIKNGSQGFTLLELLVVVLIIGILAAIALPQYKLAVGKSKFATLKNITKSIVTATQSYYLTHDSYPKKVSDLDIDWSIKSSSSRSTDLFIALTNGISCQIWNGKNTIKRVACYRKIFKKDIRFYIDRETGRPTSCLVFSLDKSNIVNRICEQETNNHNPNCNNPDGDYCTYSYL